MSDSDAISRAFVRAADLDGPELAAFLDDLRRDDPATAEEVASLLRYHHEDPAGLPGTEPDAVAPVTPMKSVLDRPAVALLGLGENEDGEAIDEDPPLPPGTLLSAEAVGQREQDEGNDAGWSYRVIRELGRGGMGVVYEAEQVFPARRVAIKLLRGGIGSGGTTVPSKTSASPSRQLSTPVVGASGGAARRLMLEAEALGALHHPGIAHVHAAGTLRLVSEPADSAGAVPGRTIRRWLFISMELVEGPSLGEWGKDRTIREKIAMLADVCDAVEHAHQRGVVHRDLKPGNVLIETGGGGAAGSESPHRSMSPPVAAQPKVLDFGVARISGRSRASRPNATLNIGSGQLIGTLRYMSPEQAGVGASTPAGGLPVADSRSDVYSLGAILYELLTGTPPIPVDDASIVGAVERITSQTPARPRNLASEIGKRSAADLETVLLKSLEKDPAARYQHAAALGEDLRRVLRDEPISARPPTSREQLMRLVRRNKVAAAAISAGMMLLLVGAAIATWQAVRATQALERAQTEAEVSQSALWFMQRMIYASSPEETRGQDVTVREMLSAAVIEARSMPDDRAAAAACRLLAESLQDIGEPAQAEPLARRALAIHRATHGEKHPDTIQSGLQVAHISSQRGQRSALNEARAWRDMAVAEQGPDSSLALKAAMTLEYCLDPNIPEQAAESEAILNDTVQRMTRLHGRHGRTTLSALSDLAALYLNLQRPADALPLAQEVFDARAALLGEDHPETIVSMGNLTAAVANVGQNDRALELNARTIELAERVLGADHPSTQYARSIRAQLFLRQARFKDAETQARAVLDARTRRLGPDTRLAMQARGLYITCVMAQGRLDEAEKMIREYITRNETLFGVNDDDTLLSVTLLYDLAEAKGDKATLDAVTQRLKGSRYDPAKAVQQPPAGTVPDKSGTPPDAPADHP